MARPFDGFRHHALMTCAGSGDTAGDDLTALGDEFGAVASQDHLFIVYAGGFVHAEHTDLTTRLPKLVRLAGRPIATRRWGHCC